MSTRYTVPLIVLLTSAAVAYAGPAAKQASQIDFTRQIKPLLAANCLACHGMDDTARQAGLRLDSREAATVERHGSAAIVPGHPERSGIIRRINAVGSPLLMPPPSSGRRLTQAERALLTRWVAQGADYALHWSFRPLVRPALPPAPTARRGAPFAALRPVFTHPIDRLVQARLRSAGLSLQKEADRYTLIRRLSLDLTGLPPTVAETDEFAGSHSPDAYERLVDRLLASPRYGEHWARMWLDLARYADTQGYEKDLGRTIWRYRDWVIDAFNSDLPYDQFTIHQLAGDLLPSPTESQILATAFHRNTMTNTEGGVDGEEFRVAAVKDRVDTTGQVWMGLTIGCAKCHSHKYDPISQKDYYRFYALFNQTEDANRGDEYPTAPMPTEEQRSKRAALDARLTTLRERFSAPLPEQKPIQEGWERSLASQGLWATTVPTTATAESGATLTPRPDGSVIASGKRADRDVYRITLPLGAISAGAIRLEALKDPSLPNGGPGRDPDDQNVVTSEITVEHIAAGQTQAASVPLKAARADFEQQGWSAAAAIDGNGETGWAWAPQNAQPHVLVADFKQPVSGGALVVTIRQNYPRLQHGCFRLSLSGADPALLRAELRSLSEIAAVPFEQRSAADRKLLDEAFRRTHEPTATVYKELAAVEKARAALDRETPLIPILRDLDPKSRRETRIHRRGNFLDPGDVVSPGVPGAFGALPEGMPANRLGAAQWIVSRQNPLTARVAVNRVWARLFGVGLVETEEDFGAQGSPPTNPELLDWLAVSFRDDLHWSMKQLCKSIVMSATYRQSALGAALSRKADPRNLWLSRGPRVRLPAEVIRDQALAVSGLLSAKMHGPSVMPPQPDGIWRTVYSGMQWKTSAGEDRYRRALYTFWRRSSPYPSMTTFDAGSGEYCVVRRVRTNTPLQALVTLNDPAFVEAAGALGRRMLTARGDTRARLAYAFRCVLVRPPVPEELARLERLYTASLADFMKRPDAALSLLKAANAETIAKRDRPDFAACITVANVLLNLDETLTKP